MVNFEGKYANVSSLKRHSPEFDSHRAGLVSVQARDSASIGRSTVQEKSVK